jgi:hypothetical protein
VFVAGRGAYGCRRVAAQLNRDGHPCSVGLAADLMRELGPQAAQPWPAYRAPARSCAAAGLGHTVAGLTHRGAGRAAVWPRRRLHHGRHDRLHRPALGRDDRPGNRVRAPRARSTSSGSFASFAAPSTGSRPRTTPTAARPGSHACRSTSHRSWTGCSPARSKASPGTRAPAQYSTAGPGYTSPSARTAATTGAATTPGACSAPAPPSARTRPYRCSANSSPSTAKHPAEPTHRHDESRDTTGGSRFPAPAAAAAVTSTVWQAIPAQAGVNPGSTSGWHAGAGKPGRRPAAPAPGEAYVIPRRLGWARHAGVRSTRDVTGGNRRYGRRGSGRLCGQSGWRHRIVPGAWPMPSAVRRLPGWPPK